MSNVEVAGLHYYPIKSCGEIDADEVTLSEFGIVHDREWMLIGANGQFLSQRVHPELALVGTHIEGELLVATAPDMGDLILPLEEDPGAEDIPVVVWKKAGSGRHAGSEAAEYFSDYLHRPACLIRVAQPRTVKPECQVPGASARMGFVDGFPLTLASLGSLAMLNERLTEPVRVDRFRPNIVVDGAPGYDEDYWRKITIGNVTAFVVRATARCPMPNIDQQLGELPKQRPVSEALRATRQGIDPLSGQQEVFFGQNAVFVFEPGAVMRVGDSVTVIERDVTRNMELTVSASQ